MTRTRSFLALAVVLFLSCAWPADSAPRAGDPDIPTRTTIVRGDPDTPPSRIERGDPDQPTVSGRVLVATTDDVWDDILFYVLQYWFRLTWREPDLPGAEPCCPGEPCP